MHIDREYFEELREEVGEIIDNRRPAELEMKEISQYILPRSGRYYETGQNPYQPVSNEEYLLDKHATRDLRRLSAGIYSGLCSKATHWFRLGAQDPTLNRMSSSKNWMDLAERALYSALASSNWYGSMHQLFEEEAGFGHGSMWILRDREKHWHCTPHTAGECYFATSSKGRINTIVRELWFTSRNLCRRWGPNNVSKQVKLDWEKKQNRHAWHRVVHVVRPRWKRDPYKIDNQNMPWESIYYQADQYDDEVALEVSGYERFRAITPRWRVIGSEFYGIGAGHDVLREVKQLQEFAYTRTLQGQLLGDPPVGIPEEYEEQATLLPGAKIYLPADMIEKVKPIYTPDPRGLQFSTEIMAEYRQIISQAMYTDLWLYMLQNPNATATEIVERKEEKLQLLGPVIERQMYEALDPSIEMQLEILVMDGVIPPPPPDLQGQPMKVEYTSVLAQAQKLSGSHSINAMLGLVGNMVGIFPEVKFKVNSWSVVEEYSDILGTPASIINDDGEAMQLREAEAKALQAKQQMDNQAQQAQTAKVLSEAAAAGQQGGALDLAAQEVGF